MKNIIAIIPARAGSKRIPGKNTVDLLGRPMIAWTIEAALKSGIFSDVLVSTDEEKIASAARHYGAAAPFLRDVKDADDYTPVSVATANALIKMEEYKSVKYDTVIQLMPNCPCRTAGDIVSSYDNFVSSEADFQISVSRFLWMNPWWAMELDKTLSAPTPLFPEAFKKRSQDLGKLFCPSGAVWIAKARLLRKEKTFYGKGYKVFPLSFESGLDIDDEDDFKMAEYFLRERLRVLKRS